MASEFAIRLAASLFGACLVLLIQYFYRRTKEFEGDYSGTWEDNIYDELNNIVKKDRYEIRQTGEILRGSIERVMPPSQSHRRYKFEGRLRSGIFFAIFWSLDQSIPSNGCWYMRQIAEGKFEGYYLKLQEDDANSIVPIRISLQQICQLPKPSWLPRPLAGLLRPYQVSRS